MEADRTALLCRGTGAKQLEHFKGQVEFRNVTFAYPNRQDVAILKDFSIKIEPGQVSSCSPDRGFNE